MIGGLGFVLSSLGCWSRATFSIRFSSWPPLPLIGVAAIALAVFVHEGFNQAGVKAILIAGLLSWANPILSDATARAARVRHKGQWQLSDEEKSHLPKESE